VALTWETANADAATVRETVANVDERVSLRLAFGDAAAGPNAAASARTTEAAPESYALKCVLCYYGEHYCAFATEETETGSSEKSAKRAWTLFDDATTKPVGAWDDVRASCEKGRLQPCVLFYQKTHPREV
jgi:ubiquitin C-terminal hydrolase